MRESISDEQKESLLKKYPTSQDIERALLIYALNENNLLQTNSEPVISGEERFFLIDKLHEDDEKLEGRPRGRFKHIQLANTISKLKELTTLFEQTFYHGAFRVLYIVEATRIEFDALIRSDALHSDETFMSDCLGHISFLEESIKRTWNNLIANSLRTLYLYDFFLEALGKIHNLNFNFVKIYDYELNLKEIQEKINSLLNVFSIYRKNDNTLKVNSALITILKDLIQFDPLRLRPQEKEIIEILTFLKKTEGFLNKLELDHIFNICDKKRNKNE